MKQLDRQDRELIDQVMADYRLTPATLARKLSRGQWIAAKHLQYISLRIAASIARGNARIIISAPPRHGKSELSSIWTPTWVLERYPWYRVILAAYGADLAVGFSRRVRDIFVDPNNQYMLNTKIRRDASKVDAFLTEQGGGMSAVGLGGPITGRGANVLLIDDYIKEIKEALSVTSRDYIWNWFVTTAFTRLEPGGSCIILATRWHSDDLIGRVLQNLSHENWEYIEIPAIAEEGDILKREVGSALFPERYPIERLHELKATLGSIFFQALYQQKPVDESKKLSDGKWLKVVKELPQQDIWANQFKYARVWDLAATNGGGDYTVGTKLAYNKANGTLYVMNVKRGQWGPKQVEEKVKETAAADGYDCEVVIEQEPGSAGISLISHYNTNVLPSFKVTAIPTVTKKLIRAQPLLAAAENGQVYLLESASWNDPFIREFDTFPGGENDDQVDTTAAGYNHLAGKKHLSASWGRDSERKNSSTANSQAHKRSQADAARGSRVGRVVWGR